MNALNVNAWEVAGGLALTTVLGAAAYFLFFRKRPTPEELERARRQLLVQSGRLVDGMLLDVCEVPAEDGSTLTLLLFSYRIAGVDYECSQDITHMTDIVDVSQVRAGFPSTVRYQPGNPHNSIVVAEEWSGLRIGLPAIHTFEKRKDTDIGHLRPSKR